MTGKQGIICSTPPGCFSEHIGCARHKCHPIFSFLFLIFPDAMSTEHFEALLLDLCNVVGIGDPDHVLNTRSMEVEGFDVQFEHFEEDLHAMYLNFHYGTVTAGRTLTVFRLMLEANLMIYAQDQAQLGLDAETGGAILIVRVIMGQDVTGEWLADLLAHYAEHGRYWRKNIFESTDEMFEGIASGQFFWIRA